LQIAGGKFGCRQKLVSASSHTWLNPASIWNGEM
jgi:hypothetical protein